MADPREAILARLFEVAKTVVGNDNTFRNTSDIPDKIRPAICILDGDETTDESNFGRKRPANAPLIMGLEPEIWLVTSNGSDDIGADLHRLKKRVLHAVLSDAPLLALCHDGEVRYEGMTTALANGRGMVGQAQLFVRFMYVMRPAAL